MLGPPVLPHLLVSWMCPNTYTRARHYLSWGPSLAVILCGKSQHRSQQVLWLLSVWKANRGFYRGVRDAGQAVAVLILSPWLCCWASAPQHWEPNRAGNW